MTTNQSAAIHTATTEELAQVGAMGSATAFELVRKDLEKVDPKDLLKVNGDVMEFVVTVVRHVPTFRTFRAEIVSTLPQHDIASFDKLEPYALAAAFAHTTANSTSTPPEAIQPLVDELTIARDLMTADFSVLAKRKLVDAAVLDELQGGTGFKNLATDVMTITKALRSRWSVISTRTGLQESELARAEKLADELLVGVALRDQGQNAAVAAADMRQRAFTVLVNAYDEFRRALGYLRFHEEDADTIAPSLYAGRGTSKKKATAPLPDATPQPGAPAPTNGGAHPSPAIPPNGDPAKAPGMPGNDPFGRG